MDLETIEALAQALVHYSGTVVLSAIIDILLTKLQREFYISTRKQVFAIIKDVMWILLSIIWSEYPYRTIILKE